MALSKSAKTFQVSATLLVKALIHSAVILPSFVRSFPKFPFARTQQNQSIGLVPLWDDFLKLSSVMFYSVIRHTDLPKPFTKITIRAHRLEQSRIGQGPDHFSIQFPYGTFVCRFPIFILYL